MVGILVALVLVLSAGAAGAVFAPRLLNKPATPPKEAAPAEADEEAAADAHGDAADEEHAEEAEPAEEPKPPSGRQRAGVVGELTELAPIVIDARTAAGEVRHLKIILVIEHPKDVKGDEFRKFVPFAREAAISFLRSREFEQLADPKIFEALRKQLSAEIIGAVGKKHAKRVLITDFVVQ